MPSFAILFKLRDVRDIAPWGTAGTDDKSLSWFGLTDGCYCIDTPAGRLLEHAEAADPGLEEPWVEYPVARIFEDLVTLLPVLCDPIPDDIIAYFADWNARHCTTSPEKAGVGLHDKFTRWLMHQQKWRTDRALAETLDVAQSWWRERNLDTGYLEVKPALQLWRTGPDLHLAWDAEPPWSPAHARLTLPFEEIREAVALFFRDFLEMMSIRVAAIARSGWTRRDCRVDVPRLIAEQFERKDMALTALFRLYPTDWDLMRASLRALKGRTASPRLAPSPKSGHQ